MQCIYQQQKKDCNGVYCSVYLFSNYVDKNPEHLQTYIRCAYSGFQLFSFPPLHSLQILSKIILCFVTHLLVVCSPCKTRLGRTDLHFTTARTC